MRPSDGEARVVQPLPQHLRKAQLKGLPQEETPDSLLVLC